MAALPVWLIWLIIAIALVLVDIFGLGLQFILVVASIAALIAGAASVAVLGFTGQIWAFVLGVLVLVSVWIFLSLRAFPEEAWASGTGLGKGRHREHASGRQGVEWHPG